VQFNRTGTGLSLRDAKNLQFFSMLYLHTSYREIFDSMIGKGFKYASWNFLESEHGKGAPDRVGAALKRAAHSFVLHGKDITNTSTFTNCFKDKESNISLYEVCANYSYILVCSTLM
jgi:hypothetical protein